MIIRIIITAVLFTFRSDFINPDEMFSIAAFKSGEMFPVDSFTPPNSPDHQKKHLVVFTKYLGEHVKEKKKIIFSDDFSSPLSKSKWIVEMDPSEGSSVYTRNQSLILDTRKGVTVWLTRRLQKNIMIEFDREVLVDSGKNDRLSDMNMFWMANDPGKVKPFGKSGIFEQYDSLLLYYAGIGGNMNTTTRFRKYEGDGRKPLIKEYLDPPHLLTKNYKYHIRIIVKNNVTSLWMNDECYFEFADPKPLSGGYFGFRSSWSRQAITNFKVYQLK